MKMPWNPPNPVEDLFKQLREGKEFAAKRGAVISDKQLIRYGCDILKATGVLTKACTSWRSKAEADKTWANFQTFFTKEVNDYNKNCTAEDQMYTAAQVNEIIEQQAAQIIATANNENQQTVQPSYVQEQANAVTVEDVQKIIQSALQANGGGNNRRTRRNRNNKNGNENGTNKVRIAQGFNAQGKPICYCWTHGVTTNLNHSSMTCRRQAEGHKTAVTLNNRMGGSDIVNEPRT